MTRKDFQLIADAVHTAYVASLDDKSAQGACVAVAIHLADKLQSTNPRFDRSRFIRACTER